MNAPFTALDVIVFVIVLLSGVLAMLRGFTREVLSILSWVVALGAAAFAYLNPDIRGQIHGLVQPDWLADAVLVGATFVIVLIVISFITVRITDLILDSRVGAIDRTLGLFFGVARGLVLVAVAYLFFAWLVPAEQQPGWVRNAQARPYMESSREVLLSLLPEDPSDLIDQLPDSLRNIGRGSGDGGADDAGSGGATGGGTTGDGTTGGGTTGGGTTGGTAPGGATNPGGTGGVPGPTRDTVPDEPDPIEQREAALTTVDMAVRA